MGKGDKVEGKRSVMMSEDEVQAAFPNINPQIARAAVDDADLRLLDVLATKAGFEQKAMTFLNVYIVVALALLSVCGMWFRSTDPWMAIPFLAAAVAFLGGAVCFSLALLDDIYGARGSDPSVWLRQGVLTGDEAVFALTLAHRARARAGTIDASLASNNRKRRCIRVGMILGIVAPVLCVVLALWVKPPSADSHQSRAAVAAKVAGRPVVAASVWWS